METIIEVALCEGFAAYLQLCKIDIYVMKVVLTTRSTYCGAIGLLKLA